MRQGLFYGNTGKKRADVGAGHWCVRSDGPLGPVWVVIPAVNPCGERPTVCQMCNLKRSLSAEVFEPAVPQCATFAVGEPYDTTRVALCLHVVFVVVPLRDTTDLSCSFVINSSVRRYGAVGVISVLCPLWGCAWLPDWSTSFALGTVRVWYGGYTVPSIGVPY